MPRTIAGMWELYRRVVVCDEDTNEATAPRNAFYCGALSVLGAILDIAVDQDKDRAAEVMSMLRECQEFRDDAAARSAAYDQKGTAS